MKGVFVEVDEAYERNILGDLHGVYHNHLVKYKNYDRIHLHAVKLYNRHFNDVWTECGYHPNSRLGQFILACITAGYVKAKMEMENE